MLGRPTTRNKSRTHYRSPCPEDGCDGHWITVVKRWQERRPYGSYGAFETVTDRSMHPAGSHTCDEKLTPERKSKIWDTREKTGESPY